jgi:hypothetical protein
LQEVIRQGVLSPEHQVCSCGMARLGPLLSVSHRRKCLGSIQGACGDLELWIFQDDKSRVREQQQLFSCKTKQGSWDQSRVLPYAIAPSPAIWSGGPRVCAMDETQSQLVRVTVGKATKQLVASLASGRIMRSDFASISTDGLTLQ